MIRTFSSPYGDCTVFRMTRKADGMFSPPYGDDILNISQNIAKLKS